MKESWNVFFANHFAGVLNRDVESNSFSFELTGDEIGKKKATEILCLDEDWWQEILMDRCFPPDRVNARELLDHIGLLRYDAWEIIKWNRLILDGDMLWMSKGNDPNEFFKVHPGACCYKKAMEEGRVKE